MTTNIISFRDYAKRLGRDLNDVESLLVQIEDNGFLAYYVPKGAVSAFLVFEPYGPTIRPEALPLIEALKRLFESDSVFRDAAVDNFYGVGAVLKPSD